MKPRTKPKRIQIVNKTKYRTSDLRALVRAVAERELDPEDRKLVATFKPSRMHVSGRGWRGGILVRIPPPGADVREVAMVIAHEMAHHRGMRGRSQERDMRHGEGTRYGWVSVRKGMYDWAKEFPLRPEEPKKKERLTGESYHAAKSEHYAKLLASWRTKLKRAQTMARKYQQKIRYHERQQKRAAMKVKGDE